MDKKYTVWGTKSGCHEWIVSPEGNFIYVRVPQDPHQRKWLKSRNIPYGTIESSRKDDRIVKYIRDLTPVEVIEIIF